MTLKLKRMLSKNPSYDILKNMDFKNNLTTKIRSLFFQKDAAATKKCLQEQRLSIRSTAFFKSCENLQK